MKNILFLIMLIRAMVLYLRIRYNIFLRHNIAFTYCLHIKGQSFFVWSFYFYCLVLVNPMIISTKCVDLLLCTFKTGHLLLIIMVTDCINQLRKNDDSQTIFNS